MSDAGDKETGCVHAVVVPSARQMFPTSPGMLPPLQLFVLRPYPLAPCTTYPPAAELWNTTGEGFVEPAGAPIWPTVSPLAAMI